MDMREVEHSPVKVDKGHKEAMVDRVLGIVAHLIATTMMTTYTTGQSKVFRRATGISLRLVQFCFNCMML